MRGPLFLATVTVGVFATASSPRAERPLGTPSLHAERAPPRIPQDPVVSLRDRLERGEVALARDSVHGYLPGLLEALDIPVSSQLLVFSRTSLQTDRIAPWAPRALYFNDDVYVGWVQESPILEIASIDPVGGARFYTLPQDPSVPPTFVREGTACLMCHESRSVTGGVPGLIMRSVLADRLGYYVADVHSGSTDPRTPFAQRWGGWYVTGTHGETGHAGNTRSTLLASEIPLKERHLREIDFGQGGNRTSLEGFDTDAYLSPHSDIVALMVLTHQAHVHNLITLVHEEAGDALRLLALARRRDPTAGSDGLPGQLRGPMDRLLEALFFVAEAPLDGPVRGTTSFAEDFARRGPSDAEGRSLRDFDLDARLFRYRLSFMVYSDAFDALPGPVFEEIAGRIGRILRGEDADPTFAHLDDEERTAILEILRATEPRLLGEAPAP